MIVMVIVKDIKGKENGEGVKDIFPLIERKLNVIGLISRDHKKI